MACDGVGPSQTCLNLARGAVRAGYQVDVFANRIRVRIPDIPMTLALPGPLAQLPYRWVRSRITPDRTAISRRGAARRYCPSVACGFAGGAQDPP